jgi:hypothetical protein
MGSIAIVYFATVLISGILTSESVVPPGSVKCFDDWCVTVTDSVEYGGFGESSPSGRFVVVDVKVFGDAKRVVQKGSNPHIYLLDEKGRRYGVIEKTQAAFERMAGSQPPLTTPVAPGESFTARKAFDVPKDCGNLRVLVTEQPWITKIVLFNENSFFSGKTVFSIHPRLVSK